MSERLAGLADLAWRRRAGQQPDPSRARPPDPQTSEEAAAVERIVGRLDELSRAWRRLQPGDALLLPWPTFDLEVRTAR
jgi:hypothetical protein